MKALIISLAAALALATGCASRPPLKHETLDKILEHQTTRSQVEELLGSPDHRASDSSQRTLTVYEDNKARPRFHLIKEKWDFSYFRAFFLFEPDGVLRKKLISETKTSSTQFFGVVTVGTPITDDQISKLKPLMRADEVLQILGPPIYEELTLDAFIVRRWAFAHQGFAARAKTQIITIVFEGETDLVKNFTIQDDLPPGQKKAK